MSLLDSPATAHAPAVNLFARRLGAGDEQERALLLNLREEDRVPNDKRTAFHAALAGSRRRAWNARFKEAASAAQRALPVSVPHPRGIAGTWWHHVKLKDLQKYKFVSLALQRVSRPPPRMRNHMITAKALANLSEPKLRAWILARMREEQVDPPIDESRPSESGGSEGSLTTGSR